MKTNCKILYENVVPWKQKWITTLYVHITLVLYASPSHHQPDHFLISTDLIDMTNDQILDQSCFMYNQWKRYHTDADMIKQAISTEQDVVKAYKQMYPEPEE